MIRFPREKSPGFGSIWIIFSISPVLYITHNQGWRDRTYVWELSFPYLMFLKFQLARDKSIGHRYMNHPYHISCTYITYNHVWWGRTYDLEFSFPYLMFLKFQLARDKSTGLRYMNHPYHISCTYIAYDQVWWGRTYALELYFPYLLFHILCFIHYT